MRVIIIEDEKLAVDRLQSILCQYDPDIEIVSRIDSVKKSIEWLDSNPAPDLAFMDIQLGDGLSFEIFEKTNAYFPVIFTTAYSEYVLKAFQVNSIDYLLKPISLPGLEKALNKFKKIDSLKAPIEKEQLKNAKEILEKVYKRRFIVKRGEHLQFISIDKINCFYSKEKMTYLNTTDNKNHIIEYTMEELESLLPPESFFRINRKFIVSIHSIKDIVAYFNSRLKVSIKNVEDDDILISRENVKEFKDWLNL